jgi:hypothetical protein
MKTLSRLKFAGTFVAAILVAALTVLLWGLAVRKVLTVTPDVSQSEEKSASPRETEVEEKRDPAATTEPEEGRPIQAEEKSRVVLTTDKTQYRQGELVNITVSNGLEKTIWYTDFGCYPWWELEKQGGKEWESIRVLLPILTQYGEQCIACPPPESMADVLVELEPNSAISKVWNLRNCKGSTPAFIDSGMYRLSFAYGFSKDSWNDEMVYSNEFTIRK